MKDLSLRKHRFIEEVMIIEDASVMEALERVLRQEKEKNSTISSAQKDDLDQRLKKYSKNPDDLLDWAEGNKNW